MANFSLFEEMKVQKLAAFTNLGNTSSPDIPQFCQFCGYEMSIKKLRALSRRLTHAQPKTLWQASSLSGTTGKTGLTETQV